MSAQRVIKVGDIMAVEFPSIDGLATVAEAMALMKQRGVDALVVNRRDATDEAGLVLLSDIAGEVIGRNRSPERVNVYEIMNKPALTLPADMLARYAVRLLTRFQVSHAVVVDPDRNPVGLVTVRNLVLGPEPAAQSKT